MKYPTAPNTSSCWSGLGVYKCLRVEMGTMAARGVNLFAHCSVPVVVVVPAHHVTIKELFTMVMQMIKITTTSDQVNRRSTEAPPHGLNTTNTMSTNLPKWRYGGKLEIHVQVMQMIKIGITIMKPKMFPVSNFVTMLQLL